jgi:DNA-binding protein H-NS
MKKSSLAQMSVEALLDTKDAIEKMLTEKTAQLRKQLASLTGLGDAPKRGRPKGKSKMKGKKVAPKYRGPNGETWAGRGAQPVWLREALKKGRKLESFSVEKKGKAKAAKPKRKYTKRAKGNGAASTSQPEGQTAAS